jgi:4-diphosphocytidyl-2-C-methyl-D-erythritol kinase
VILRALAPAKINLGLFVGPSRPDGRHRLVSVMQSISLADELTLECPVGGSPRGDRIVCPDIPGLAGPENLAARALAAFRLRTGWDPGPIRLTIVKRVPVAAGLGGGSGDAAAALRLAARASGRHEEALLLELAAGLGADVPAQVTPGRWLACGAGESLRRLSPPCEPFAVLVLAHDEGLSTAEVYDELDRLGAERDDEQLRELGERLHAALGAGAALPPRELLVNDLQQAALSLRPEIEHTLAQAREAGADIALVSGSGPTVLGLFEGADAMGRARAAQAALGARSPRPLVAGPASARSADVAAVRNNGPAMRSAASAEDPEV